MSDSECRPTLVTFSHRDHSLHVGACACANADYNLVTVFAISVAIILAVHFRRGVVFDFKKYLIAAGKGHSLTLLLFQTGLIK